MTAKKVLEYARKNEKLKVGIGLIEGTLCASDELKAVAGLPPKKVLLSIMAGTFQAPLSNLASALTATLTKFAYVLEAIKNKKVEAE